MTDAQALVALELVAQGFEAGIVADVLNLPAREVQALIEDQETLPVPNTAPLRAILYGDREKHRTEKLPGSIWIGEAAPGEQAALWFWCPCGCGMPTRITVGHGFKPKTYVPSWKWNGSRTEPTLDPSVNQTVCGWHGWLRDGYWERV